MKVVYLKVLRDVLCESVDIEWLVDYVIPWVRCRCSEYEVKKLYHLSKEAKMKMRREAL